MLMYFLYCASLGHPPVTTSTQQITRTTASIIPLICATTTDESTTTAELETATTSTTSQTTISSTTTTELETATTSTTSQTTFTTTELEITTTTSQTTTTTKSTATTTTTELQTPKIETALNITKLYSCDAHEPYYVSAGEVCCDGDPSVRNMTPQQVQVALTELRKTLLLNTSTLSSYKRKMTSARDERTSSRAMGILGITVLVSLAVLILAIDAPLLLVHFKMLLRNVRLLK